LTISAAAAPLTEACALLLVPARCSYASPVNLLSGLTLTRNAVGNLIDLPGEKARLLIAEGWAMEERREPFGGRRDVVAFRRAEDPGPLRVDDDEASKAS
jgi:hypothetical protein